MFCQGNFSDTLMPIIKSVLTLSLSSFTVVCLFLNINYTVTCQLRRQMLCFPNNMTSHLSEFVLNFNPPGSRLFSSGFMTLHRWQLTRWVGPWDMLVLVLALPPLRQGSMASSCLHHPTSTVWQPSCGTAMSCLLTTTCMHCSTESSLSQS